MDRREKATEEMLWTGGKRGLKNCSGQEGKIKGLKNCYGREGKGD